MSATSDKWFIGLACAAAAAVCSLAAPAKLHRVTPVAAATMEAKLNHALLPDGAQRISVERDQMFTLSDSKNPLTLIPVIYEAPGQDAQSGKFVRCGLFIASSAGQQKFVPTIGTDQTEAEQCDGLAALGVADDPGDHPRIILVYHASSPNTHLLTNQILLWQDDQYQVDAATSSWLDDRGGPATVASARRLLKTDTKPAKTAQ